MKKSTRRNIIAALTLSAVCSFGIAGAAFTAYADNAVQVRSEDVFFDGAGVYLGNVKNDVDRSGIRFCVMAKQSVLESKTVGAVLAFKDQMGNDTELTLEDTYASKRNEVLSTAADKWQVSTKYTVQGDEEDAYKFTYVYIYDFTEDAYNRDISINPYVLDGTTYTYAGTESRSMSQVALAANADGFDASKYIKSYNVNYFNGEEKMTYSTTATYGETLTEPTVTEDNFLGWYADADFTETFDFTQIVKGTVNVYAKFKAEETLEGVTFNLSTTDDYTLTVAGTVETFTLGGKEVTVSQTGTTVTIENTALKALGLKGAQTAVIETTEAIYNGTITLSSNGYVAYKPNAIVKDSAAANISTNADGHTVYAATTATNWSERRVKINGVTSYSQGQYVALELYCAEMNVAHDQGAGAYFYNGSSQCATRVATYEKATKAKITAGQNGVWYILVFEVNVAVDTVGGYKGTFMFGSDSNANIVINNSYVFDDAATFNSWIEPKVIEGMTKYGPSAIVNVSGATLTTENSYTVYHGNLNGYDTRRVKIDGVTSYTAGQYVAIEAYCSGLDLVGGVGSYFFDADSRCATRVGCFNLETKKSIESGAQSVWCLIVYQIRGDVSSISVTGYPGSFTFAQGSSVQVKINNSYVFNGEAVFNTWMNS